MQDDISPQRATPRSKAAIMASIEQRLAELYPGHFAYLEGPDGTVSWEIPRQEPYTGTYPRDILYEDHD